MAKQKTPILASGTSPSLTLTGSSAIIPAIGGTPEATISFNKFTYHVLGQDIEVDSAYGDPSTGMCVALINTLGIKYYEELKKQKISFPGKLGEFLEENLKSYYRDQKIEQVIK